ncbi:MAG: 2-hydroxycarboxylate transporter family protein [Burkholderiaceae bacterium]|nr:2-hydroxycarboxylate transporter family protein [Roseateles sp.]MBV8468696.1 2-hydroxycarboxylate transporter family protein [Burkholderiaceae bacterium]
MESRVGVIPLPVYVLVGFLIWAMVASGKVPNEISVAIVVFSFFGFTLGELGKRIPVLKHVGAAAILATFVPSALVYYKVLPPALVSMTTDFTKSSNFLYLFIASIIVGSILSMDRKVLIQGFLKIFIPLTVGTVAAGVVGTLVGTALGIGTYKTFFFIVVPIMAGGVGEGAIPLSMGYAEILHQEQGELFALVLPSVMLGSLSAILISGALNFVGKKYPHLTGEGRLQAGEGDDVLDPVHGAAPVADVVHMAAAGVTALTLYMAGLACHRWFGLPAPISMLFLAVMLKLVRAISPEIEAGSAVVYRFFSVAVTYPLLFAIGVSMTPWDKLVNAFNLPTMVTILATVSTLVACGGLVGKWLKMYPIDAAIVTACHSGQGGTGDVAILTAANRMSLMPFAQIATRIGGAITVTLVLIFLTYLQH